MPRFQLQSDYRPEGDQPRASFRPIGATCHRRTHGTGPQLHEPQGLAQVLFGALQTRHLERQMPVEIAGPLGEQRFDRRRDTRILRDEIDPQRGQTLRLVGGEVEQTEAPPDERQQASPALGAKSILSSDRAFWASTYLSCTALLSPRLRSCRILDT